MQLLCLRETLSDLWETFVRPLGDLWETFGRPLGDLCKKYIPLTLLFLLKNTSATTMAENPYNLRAHHNSAPLLN